MDSIHGHDWNSQSLGVKLKTRLTASEHTHSSMLEGQWQAIHTTNHHCLMKVLSGLASVETITSAM
jgi:hypothetical protein